MRFSVRSTDGRWGPWLDAAAEEEDQPDAGAARGRRHRAAGGSATRRGSGPANGIRYRIAGRVTRPPGVVRPQPGAEDPAAGRRGGRLAADRAAQRLGRGRVDPPQRARVRAERSASRSCTTRPARTATRPRRRRRSCAGSRSTTSSRTAGTTSATTSSSTGTAPSTRAATAASTGTSSERTPAASTRARSGVAVIGTFESAAIPAAAEASLEKLLAWRLDLAHVDPLSTLTVVSGGSERYPAGIPVFLRAVSGHRDTGLTSCPGDLLYAQTRGDRGQDAGDRAAEALRAEGDGRPRRARALPGPRLRRRCRGR